MIEHSTEGIATAAGNVTVWYRQTGEYAGLVCSEQDPFAPLASPMFWVPVNGGPVVAEVDRRLSADDLAEGLDPWDCDVTTGVVLTAEQVAAATAGPR